VIREVRLVAPAVPAALDELLPAIARAGALEAEDLASYHLVGWGGVDKLGVRWALTVVPSVPGVAFAGAAAAVARGYSESEYHPDVVLEYALDPHVPLGQEAWLATAGCLVAEPPELRRVATDLVITSIEDRRFDAISFGDAIAWLADNDRAKPTRLEAPLRDVARVSPLHAAQVVRTVESLLAHLASRPHGLHAPLAVAAEGAAATGQRIQDERARATLERFRDDSSPSSKLGKLARALLATVSA
jgi:hypothetical protein